MTASQWLLVVSHLGRGCSLLGAQRQSIKVDCSNAVNSRYVHVSESYLRHLVFTGLASEVTNICKATRAGTLHQTNSPVAA